jgi:hypothetical protein
VNGTLRFLWQFVRPAAEPAAERELLLDIDDEPRGATLYLPYPPRAAGRGLGDRAHPIDPTESSPGGRRAPAWVLLQGITVLGRHHEGLRRMARSLSHAGHVVLAPEVPAWTDLRVDPRQGEPVLADVGLRAYPELDPSGRLDGLAGHATRVVLLHGRQDTLIPFTETLRLRTLLPSGIRPTVAVTALIGHARAAPGAMGGQPLSLVQEAYRFAVAMHRIVTSV